MSTAPVDLLLERSRRDLEWPQLLDAMAGQAVTDLGAARIRQIVPFAERAHAESRIGLVQELSRLAELGARLPVKRVETVLVSAERARRGGALSGVELLAVRRMLGVAIELGKFGHEHQEMAPGLALLLAPPASLANLHEDLEWALDESGRLEDRASPALGGLRTEVMRARQSVQKRIGELMQRYKDVLQDAFWTEHDGRYVLPVRSDAGNRPDGVVLGASGSGATLYVEPAEMASIGNKLRVAEAAVAREEARILAELTAELAPHADDVRASEALVVEADLLCAVTAFSVRARMTAIDLAAEQVIDLKAARHPMLVLAGGEVVENDVAIASGRGLVVSGPNAGGKTVLLKCLGQSALLAAAGLPIPADPGSRVGFFELVLSDIGDDQSLAQSLSTFSGHVERVRDMLELAAPETLVLLDEPMGGTDPGEGAALAVATIDEFVRRGAALCVTTHYEALKEHAVVTPLLESAAAGFDFDRMRPTFRVAMGRPGASSALYVARRHGLPAHVTERADSILPELDRKKRETTQELEQARADLDEEERLLRARVLEVERLERKVKSELEAAQNARKAALGGESDELRAGVRAARAQLRHLLGQMKDAGAAAELRALEKSLDGVASTVSLGSDVDRALRAGHGAGSPGSEVRVGARVRLRGMNVDAEVLEIDGKKARVAAGAMKLTVSLDELLPVTKKPEPAPRKVKQAAPSPARARETPVKSQDMILDLRGQRVEAALGEIDSFVDELLRRHESGGWVLHGHGTGALKDAVRSHLRGHPTVSDSRAAERDEGGDAFTIFWFVG